MLCSNTVLHGYVIVILGNGGNFQWETIWDRITRLAGCVTGRAVFTSPHTLLRNPRIALPVISGLVIAVAMAQSNSFKLKTTKKFMATWRGHQIELITTTKITKGDLEKPSDKAD